MTQKLNKTLIQKPTNITIKGFSLFFQIKRLPDKR